MMTRRRLRGDRGSGAISIFVVMMLPVLWMAAALVWDGGNQLRERRAAAGDAAAVARAAGQYTQAESFASRVHEDLATQRGREELRRRGVKGTVDVDADTGTITVVVYRHADGTFLPGKKVSGQATTTALHGATSASGP